MIQKRYNLHVRQLTKEDVFEGGYGQKIFEAHQRHLQRPLRLFAVVAKADRPIRQDVFPACRPQSHQVGGRLERRQKLVGIGITIPSLSRALQKCHRGRLLPFGWWHVIRAIKFHKTNILDLLLMGVLPEYRAKGVNGLMIADIIPYCQKHGIEWGETQVEMETNTGVQSQWGVLEPVLHKRRKCYKKILQ